LSPDSCEGARKEKNPERAPLGSEKSGHAYTFLIEKILMKGVNPMLVAKFLAM
jgi:hypothetical protein